MQRPTAKHEVDLKDLVEEGEEGLWEPDGPTTPQENQQNNLAS